MLQSVSAIISISSEYIVLLLMANHKLARILSFIIGNYRAIYRRINFKLEVGEIVFPPTSFN